MTAYEMRISDWSSDVCSSDLATLLQPGADYSSFSIEFCAAQAGGSATLSATEAPRRPIGRSGPVVVSRKVWRSSSALTSAPMQTASAEMENHSSSTNTDTIDPDRNTVA